jgi:hypothetical protein
MSEPVVKAIGTLQTTLGRLQEQQTKVLLDSMAPLKNLPQITETQTRQLLEAAYDGVRAQVLVAIAQQSGQLGAKESQINEELQEIKELQEAAEERAHALSDSMHRQLDEISETTRELVDQMDKPVLDLGRKVFSESVFLPYTEQVVPHWRLQVAVGQGSREVRRLSFNQGYKGVVSRVNHYLSEVDKLQDLARDLRVDQDLPDEIGIPICIVQYRDEEALKDKIYIAPKLVNENKVTSSLHWFVAKIKGSLGVMKGQLSSHMREIWDKSNRNE